MVMISLKRRMKMPVVVKKRLLDLLQDNQQNYYELFVFSLILMFLALRKRKRLEIFLLKR